MKTQVFVAVAIPIAVVLPFLIFGSETEEWSQEWLRVSDGRPHLVAFAVVTLLASDVILPVPSSIVSTGSGAILGLALGAVCSTLGMTLSCIVGYGIGAWSARTARRLADDAAMDEAVAMFARHGHWAVVGGRAVPVIAESTTIYAGVCRMPFARFLALAALANTGTSLAYATVGAYAAGLQSFLFAFVGSIVLPVGSMVLWRRAPWLRRAVTDLER